MHDRRRESENHNQDGEDLPRTLPHHPPSSPSERPRDDTKQCVQIRRVSTR